MKNTLSSQDKKSLFKDARASTALRIQGQETNDSFLLQPEPADEKNDLISPSDSDFNSQVSMPFFLKNIQKQNDHKAEKSNKVGHFGSTDKI